MNNISYSDMKGDTIHLRGTKTATSDRHVEISGKDMQHIKQTLSKHSFGLHGPLFGLSHNAVAKTFSTAKLQLHIDDKKTLHSLRHTHCSYLLSTGRSLDYVSKRLGHKNTAITSEIYSHLLKTQYTAENEAAKASCPHTRCSSIPSNCSVIHSI